MRIELILRREKMWFWSLKTKFSMNKLILNSKFTAAFGSEEFKVFNQSFRFLSEDKYIDNHSVLEASKRSEVRYDLIKSSNKDYLSVKESVS